MSKNLGEFVNIPIWIDHPESDSHFVGSREDLVDTCVEVGYAILGTEEEYERLKENGGDIQEIEGNIFNLTSGIICHQVNCKGVMGAGLALKIRNKWPVVYEDYLKHYNSFGLKPGDVIWSKVGENLWVASLAGQDGYGREKGVVYTNYDAVRLCLITVAATGVYPVAIPKGMGCTLAGGDWETMLGIIKGTVPHALIIDHIKQQVIDCFAGQHGFLSNFEPSPIQMLLDAQQAQLVGTDRLVFNTVEHYYQAMKSTHPVIWWAISQLGTPGAAKRAGNGKPFNIKNNQYIVQLRPDWERVKVGIMESALRAKFQIPELRNKLLATGSSELIEGNTWNDTFWGVCRGKGENTLGKLLMKIRGEIK